jgi:1-acyl-sn-glycerol-3-phosphate acyltransferase
MIYQLLKPLVKTALRLYFREINVRGMEAIDNGGPTLILANHTASFMDALITACFVRRRIHFFARGDVFANPIADKVLRSIGLMPVYRLSEGRDKLPENDRSNEEATKILQEGGAVLIFAEGFSHTDKVLKPLKKGPFRLAVSAVNTLDKQLLIVPLGINYIFPAKPLGDAFLEGAPAFEVPREEAAQNPVHLATSLMRHTAEVLKPLAWDVQDEQLRPKADLLLAGLSQNKPDYTFEETQELLKGMQENPETPAAQFAVFNAEKKKRNGLLLTLGAPFAFIGIVGNYLPVRFAKWIADSKVTEMDFWAPIFVCAAIIGVLLWYLLLIIVGILFHFFIEMIILLTIIAACGAFYLKKYRNL